jgi:hypothetical protein
LVLRIAKKSYFECIHNKKTTIETTKLCSSCVKKWSVSACEAQSGRPPCDVVPLNLHAKDLRCILTSSE